MKSQSTNQSEVPNSAAPVKGLESLQFTGTTTTNGATTVGVNINAGKGPREGWNVGANYDINGGTVSGSVGYTDPGTGFGLTSTIDRNGLSTSGQLNGINIATNGPDGFVMEEMNWAEQNINLAQDRTNDLRDNATLKAAGFSDEQIANMKPQDRADLLAIATADQVLRDEGGYSQDAIKKMTADQRQKLAADLTRPAFDPEAIAVGAAASVGTFFAGALAFAGGAPGTGTGQTPTNTRADGPVVGRRREDGEDADLSDPDSKRMRELDADVNRWERELASTEHIADASSDQQSSYTKYRDYVKSRLAEARNALSSFLPGDRNAGGNPGDGRGSGQLTRNTNVANFGDSIQNLKRDQVMRLISDSADLPSGTKLTLAKGISPITREVTIMGDGQKPMIGKEGTVSALNEKMNLQIKELLLSPLRSDEIKAAQNKLDLVNDQKTIAEQKVPRSDTEINGLKVKLKETQAALNKVISGEIGRCLASDPEFAREVRTSAQMKADLALNSAQSDLLAFHLKESPISIDFESKKQALENKIKDAELAKSKADETTIQRLSLLVKERDPVTGNMRMETLSSVSNSLVERGRVPVTKTETFKVYHDEEGNPHLLPGKGKLIDAISLERGTQEAAFHRQVESINQTGSGYIIKPETGMIERNAKGERIDPNNFKARQDAFKELKASLGSAFDPKTNPNHAKLEAVNNFEEVRNRKGDIDHFETSINGIKIKTMNAGGDLNYQSIQASNGSTWLDVTNAAGSVGATEVSINSIIKPGAHSNGFALDVGSITVKNDLKEPVVLSIRYKDGTPNTISTEPPPQLKTFLDKIKNSQGTTFYATPWEVRMNGQVYENNVSAVRPDLWSIGNLDPSNKNLTPEIENEIYTTIAEAAGLDPVKNQDIIKQMWNHRHHLHVSEVGSPDVH
jgi:hypothetical protein